MLGQTMAESSAVGSALRSGRRGRAFDSPLSDKNEIDMLCIQAFISFGVYTTETK